MIIDIKQEYYFPFTFRLFGLLLILACPLTYISQPHVWYIYLIMGLLPLPGLMLITARYGLRIDTDNRSFKIYIWILGYRSGKIQNFMLIEKFYINQVTESMLLNTRTGAQHDIKNQIYKAYMKLDSGEKIHVDTDKNLVKLQARMHRLLDQTANFTKHHQIF